LADDVEIGTMQAVQHGLGGHEHGVRPAVEGEFHPDELAGPQPVVGVGVDGLQADGAGFAVHGIVHGGQGGGDRSLALFAVRRGRNGNGALAQLGQNGGQIAFGHGKGDENGAYLVDDAHRPVVVGLEHVAGG